MSRCCWRDFAAPQIRSGREAREQIPKACLETSACHCAGETFNTGNDFGADRDRVGAGARSRHHAGRTALAGCRTGGMGWAETQSADQPRPGARVGRAEPRTAITTRPNHLPGKARRLESIKGPVQRSLDHEGFDQRARRRVGNPSVRSRRRGKARYWVHCG